jgi:flagellar basal-body rod protein FlgF
VTEVSTQVSSSLNALMKEFDVITQNLANVSTTGYKRRCSNFSAALAAQISDAGEGENANVIAPGQIDFSQGNVIETGRPLDVALDGKGFFVIETPDGPLYTRHGVFRMNQNGQIVDGQGRMVAGDAGPLSVPAEVDTSEIRIGDDGRIFARGSLVGQFRIVDFAKAGEALKPVGYNCFQAAKDAELATAETVVTKQGYQEASNVQVVEEMVNMIMVSRIYEANTKLLNAKKDTSNSAIGVAMG